MNELPINTIRLNSDSEFAARFNYLSDLWAKATDETLTEAERDEAFELYWKEKLQLEQGY